VEVPREQYDKVLQALADLDTPFKSVEDFVGGQLGELLEKHEAWVKRKEDFER